MSYPITSQSGQRMAGYLPPLYETSRVVRSMLDAAGAELDELRRALDEVLAQFFVRTSTWGLDKWEEALGLPPAPNLTEAERRDRIVSHIRGTGTATISVVRQVAEAYDKGSIDIIEDHAAYTVIVRFVDTRGVPTNIDDLKAAVRAVLPAHLDVVYQFRYLLWSELDARQLTWEALDQMALTWPELEVLV
ncbi:MAG: YmfQ family protein [Symbiobacteriaceae bacterium]